MERDEAVVAELLKTLDAVVDDALAKLDTMRVTEGDHLNADLESRRAGLAVMLEQIAGGGR